MRLLSELAILGVARISKRKERAKKQVIALTSGKLPVYQLGRNGAGRGSLSFQSLYNFSVCLEETGKHFRGRNGNTVVNLPHPCSLLIGPYAPGP